MPIRRRGTQARRHPGRRIPFPDRRHVAFETLVERALDDLPPMAQRWLEEVAIVIEDEPSPRQLRENEVDEDSTLYGLYEGVPLIEYGADLVPFPNKITLFRLPLEEDYPDPDELAAEVRRTVLHELGHHVGIPDSRMHDLGLA